MTWHAITARGLVTAIFQAIADGDDMGAEELASALAGFALDYWGCAEKSYIVAAFAAGEVTLLVRRNT